MPRPQKDSKALNIKISSSLYAQMEQYSIESKLTKTAIVELALEKYFSESKLKERTSKRG